MPNILLLFDLLFPRVEWKEEGRRIIKEFDVDPRRFLSFSVLCN